MKQFLSWLGKKFISAFITSVFFVLCVFGIVYATISWPTGTPGGTEVAGGKFMTYFNAILVDTGATTDGKVKNADKLDGYNHSAFVKTEIDPKVGTLTNGKWCKSDGSDVICTYDAPTTSVVAPIGSTTIGNLIWSAEQGAKTYFEAQSACNAMTPVWMWRVPTTGDIDKAVSMDSAIFQNWVNYWSSDSNQYGLWAYRKDLPPSTNRHWNLCGNDRNFCTNHSDGNDYTGSYFSLGTGNMALRCVITR